ncbi:uncharacterized protein LOC143451668 isoform X2 [Clavelina lepadiformis]|uniref:uncharacterized protein LOC143451668 isoform X2 n=1 Tax=Clavelina lepadiformis TaxID=159417 RepID=UPI0040413DD6
MSSGRKNSDAANADHNVLTIFLPILAVALVACAAACFWMERRRRTKLKKGVFNAQDDHISDTDSIATSVSSRYRPYMMPTPTTGRVYRSGSRAGSVRGAYDLDSNYGEPPPYSGSSRRSSVASLKALREDGYTRKGATNDGYASSRSSLNRSRSMLDVRDDFGSAPLRRTRSSSNIQTRYDDDFPDVRSSLQYAEDRGQQRSRQTSPATSEWSVRTAPQMTNYTDYAPGRPSSVASLPVRGRRSNMRRSLSQPNLSQSSLTKTGTYPQGILKRQNNQGPSSDSGIKDYYADRDSGVGASPNQMEESTRPSTRPSSSYGAARGRYDPYYHDASGNYPTYPGVRGTGNYEDPVYAVSAGVAYPKYGTAPRDWSNQYPSNYDPYSYGPNYWDHQNGGTAMQQSQAGHDPFGYNSMIY